MIPSSTAHRAETTGSSGDGLSMPSGGAESVFLGSQTPKSGPSTSGGLKGQEDTVAAKNPELLPPSQQHRALDSAGTDVKCGDADGSVGGDDNDSPESVGSSGRSSSQSKETAAAREIRKVMGHLKPGSKGRKTFGGGSPRPWQCQRCTVVHEGPDANQATCPVCGALRPRGALPLTKSPKGAGSSSTKKSAESLSDGPGADLPGALGGNADDNGDGEGSEGDDDDDDNDDNDDEQESDEEAKPNDELGDNDDNESSTKESNIQDASGMDESDAVQLEPPPTTKLGRQKDSFSSFDSSSRADGGGGAIGGDEKPSATSIGAESSSLAASVPSSEPAATGGAKAASLSERQQVALALRMSQKGQDSDEATAAAAAAAAVDDAVGDDESSASSSGGHTSDRKRARENRASIAAAAATSKSSALEGDEDEDSSSSGGPRASLLPRPKALLESSVSGSAQRRSSPSLAGTAAASSGSSITDGGTKAFSTLGLASGVSKYAMSKLIVEDSALSSDELASAAKRKRHTGLSSSSSRLGARFQAEVPPTTEAKAAAAARAAATTTTTVANSAAAASMLESSITAAAATAALAPAGGTLLSTAAVSIVGASSDKAEVSTAVPVAVAANDQVDARAEMVLGAAAASIGAEPTSTTTLSSGTAVTVVEPAAAAAAVVPGGATKEMDDSAAWFDPLTAEECAAAEAGGSESWYGWARDEKPLEVCGDEPPIDALVLSSGAVSDEKAAAVVAASAGGAIESQIVGDATGAVDTASKSSSEATAATTHPGDAPVPASDSMELDKSIGSSSNASIVASAVQELEPVPLLTASRSAPLPLSLEPLSSATSAAAAEDDANIDCLGWTDEEQAAFAVLVTVHLKDFRAVSRNMPPRPPHSLPPPPFAARCNFIDDDDNCSGSSFNDTAGMRARGGSSSGGSSGRAPRSGSMDVSSSSEKRSSSSKSKSSSNSSGGSSSAGGSSGSSGPKRAYGFKPIERVEEATDGGEDVVLEEYRSGAECATKLGLTANEVSDAVRGKTIRAQVVRSACQLSFFAV